MSIEKLDYPRPGPSFRVPATEALALALGGLMFLLLWKASAPPPELLFSDFYQAYLDAATRLVTFGSIVTWPLHDTCTEGFVNIPVLGWLFAPLALLPPATAAVLFMTLGIIGLAAALWLFSRHFDLDHRQRSYVILLTLANGPLVHGLREGNTTHMVLALIIVAVVLLRVGHAFTAGALIGFCALLKLPLLLVGAYLLIAQQWRTLAGFAITGAAAVLASLLAFGPLINLGWFHYCVFPFLSATMPGFNVQSLESFVFRLINGQEHLHTWYLVPTPFPAKVARAFVSMGLLVGSLWMLALPRPAETGRASSEHWSRRELIELNVALTASIVASPLAWSHYYVLLLLPWSLYLGGALGAGADRTCRWMMTGGIVLSSLPVLMLPKDLGPLAPWLSRTVVSACFLGGVLTFAGLARCLWLDRRGEGAGAPLASWVHAVRRMLSLRLLLPLTPSEALTRGLVILLAANVALGAAMWLVAPTSLADVGLQHTWGFLRGHSDDDSWGPMANALHYIENEYYPPAGSKPLYSALVFEIGDKYQYPPFALFIAAALRDANAALSPFLSAAAVISWLAVALTAVCVAGILEISLRRVFPGARHDHLTLVRAALAILLTLTYYPVVKAFTLGQIQTWLNAAVTAAILLWLWQWRLPAGLLVGLCALVKPHYAILVAWAVIRREWTFAATGAAVIAGGIAAGILALGWEHHVDYVKLLSFISQHGEAFYPNHSVNGLLNRLMSLSDPIAFNNLFWSEATFPPYTWWVHAMTVATASLLLAAAFLLDRRGSGSHGGIDLSIVVLSCTIASPIAWEHHYGVLAPILALMAPIMLVERKLLPLACTAYLVSSQYIPLTKLVAATPLNVLQSYLFFAAAIVLIQLYRLRARQMQCREAAEWRPGGG